MPKSNQHKNTHKTLSPIQRLRQELLYTYLLIKEKIEKWLNTRISKNDTDF